jgi:hypothetical protein
VRLEVFTAETMRSAWSSEVLRRVALVVAGVSGGRVASVVGVAGVGGLGVALGVVGDRRADRSVRVSVAGGCLRGSWLAGSGRPGGWGRCVPPGRWFLRGPRGAAPGGRSSSLLHFVSSFSFFSVVFCVVFIFDVYVLVFLLFCVFDVYVICILYVICFMCVSFCSATATG